MNTIMYWIVPAIFAILGFAQPFCHGAMIDSATGIDFLPKLGSLSLFGVGVRKIGPLKIYSVGLYGSDAAKKSLGNISNSNKSGALSSLRSSVESKLPATFVLEVNLKVTGEKMASAIAKSVAPRNAGGNAKEVDELKALILSGVQSKAGGSAEKGTKFQFDCMTDGLLVSVDGKCQGKIKSSTLSKAFCDVYLDDKCVSPSLRENCILNTCKP